MAMLPGDYKRRVGSTNRAAAITSGYAVSPFPVPAGSANIQVAAAGSVITLTSINATSTAGVNMFFKDSANTKQQIMSGVTIARDYKQNFYCPWPVYVSTDVDVTVYVSPPSKGNTTA